jgi:copper chaperone
VTEEVSRLNGVSSVNVDLNAGGDSRVTVTSTAPLPVEAVREAVDEAGYTLAS